MSFLTSVRTVLTPRRLALAGAPLVLAGAAAPLMGAGPWEWRIDFGRHNDRDHGRVIVRSEPACEPERPVFVEVVPSDLKISAYQARGTIMIFVNGCNRTSGYTTSLSAEDTCGRTPTLVLHNTFRVGQIPFQVISPIDLKAAIRADGGREVRCISVRVADKTFEVPVTCVPTL